MAFSVVDTGTLTTTGGGYDLVVEQTTAGIFVVTIGLAEMTTGDMATLSTEVSMGGTYEPVVIDVLAFADLDGVAAWQSIPIMSPSACRVRVSDALGTSHDYPWACARVA